MNTQGSAILVLGAALASVACSGTYQVGSDPSGGGMPSVSSSGSGSVGPIADSGSSSGGSASDGGSTTQAGAPGVSGIVDPPAAVRCGFAPATDAAAGATATTEVLFGRIQAFLDDTTAQPIPTNLPAKATPEVAAALAMAMLDDHLTQKTEAPGLVRFLTAWLGLPLDAGVETVAAHTWAVKLLDPNATLSTLLAEPTGEPHRLGILTDPQVLSARSGIPQRGQWIQTKLFCQPVPPPPANVPAIDPATTAGVTRREKLESAVSSPTCNSCHSLLDPTGESLEHFDAMGNYRDKDAGEVVNSASSISQPMQLSFDSIEDLAPVLATSCPVAQCFAQALMTDAFATSKLKPTDADINRAANAFADSAFSIRELVKAVVTTPSFMR